MHKSIILSLALVFFSFSFGQKTTKQETYYLYFKTWNFIKYYHPDLASGRIDADSLFLTYLSGVEQIANKESFNKLIDQILNRLYESHSESRPTKENADVISKNLDFNWFEKNAFFDTKNKERLSAVFKNRYTGDDHYYIPEENYIALLPHEKEYDFSKGETVPVDYRMLALAKIQGAVDYLYPHKYLMEQNFDQLLKSQIVPMLESKNRKEYELILLKLAASLQDSHSFKFYKQLREKKEIFKNKTYPPFAYQVFEDGILITDSIIPDLCQSADIRVGDYIISINGQTVSDKITELSFLLSTSNRQTLLYHLSNYIENLIWSSDSKQFSFEILRNKKKEFKTISFLGSGDPNLKKLNTYLGMINREKVESDSLIILNREIAYFNIHETFRFIQNVADEKIDQQMDSILNLARSKKGIIFDMRGYPDWGGFVPMFVTKSFAQTLTPYAKYYQVNKLKVGTYVHKTAPDVYYNPQLKLNGSAVYGGKVVIIVNPATQSMSEWNTMNLQHIFPNSVTIGEQSAGADGDLKTMNLPGPYELDFTGNAIFYPDGTEAQKRGVKIDVPVKLTKENYSKNQDLMLLKAIELIEK
ncbi:S41 family peptidase [Fluviicola taffensis]|uniref:S41 family peptidase n=1 Tax=Fluviicola taffensis TaxID=191579 RepID=UPI003138300A